MKVWLYSLLGLAVFIGCGLLVQWSLQKNTDRLTHKLKKVEAAVKKAEWSKGNAALKQVDRSWEKIKPGWSMLLHHREIDAIDEALVSAEAAIQSKSDPESRIELNSLRHLLEHVPKREGFNLVNIL